MTKPNDTEAVPATGAKEAGDAGERVAKVLARAGLCSRREAEEWIAAGRIAVDGTVLTTPAFTVTPKNRITVDGVALPVKERTRLWLFHKPRGLVTTNQDPEGRPTVFSVLPEDMPRVVTVGRLDINTEGLLLLTNDGGVARVLELPSTGWLRRYRVRAFGEVEESALKDLAQGVSVDGVDYGPIEASIERVQGSNIWLEIGLREGKNREVKRVLASLGLTVNRLIRVSFGPFQLADLDEGEIREIRGRVLRDQLGKRLVAEAGADFDAPIVHHMQGDTDEDEGRKRKVRGFEPAPEGGRERDGRRPPRTHMEFIGTGERRTRDDRGGREDRPARDDRDDRGGRGFRSEGFRGRPGGGEGRGFRSEGFRSEGFRGRPEGGPGKRPRSEGFRDRPDGERPRSAGFRDRPDGDRPRSGGFRDRPDGDRPRSGGFRDRPDGERPRSGGFRDRPDGDRPRSGGFRSRPDGDRPRSEGFRDRAGGDRPRPPRNRAAEGDDRRPDRGAGDRPRSEGFRGRPDGAGPKRPRSEGLRDRPSGDRPFGDRPRSAGFRDRPDGDRPHGDRPHGDRPRGEAPRRGAADGFGPRGPRGMNAGGRKGDFDAPRPPRAGPGKGPRGPGKPGGGGSGKRPTGGGKGRGPRGGGGRS